MNFRTLRSVVFLASYVSLLILWHTVLGTFFASRSPQQQKDDVQVDGYSESLRSGVVISGRNIFPRAQHNNTTGLSPEGRQGELLAAREQPCSLCARAILDAGELGVIRLHLRPEWCNASRAYVLDVAHAAGSGSQIYRLEPGFLIQGRLTGHGVRKLHKTARAPKVMERGEVGWAGGGAGPDFFIYLGDGPAGWLGTPHDGTVFAEVADEESMETARRVSLLPVRPTPPGQMHLLRSPLPIAVREWPYPTSPPRARLSLRILKAAGVSLDAGSTECAEDCHAQLRTELHGAVVRWGSDHLFNTSAECCEACKRHPRCDVWVHCSRESRCKGAYRQCWLKREPAIWNSTGLLVGSSDRWTSGTLTSPPLDHPSGAGISLPSPSEHDLALHVGRPVAVAEGAARGRSTASTDGACDGGPLRCAEAVTLRLRLRWRGAPRAAKRLWAALQENRLCAHADCFIHKVVRASESWGSDALPDGLNVTSRWPAGAALVDGTMGDAGAPSDVGASVAVEPNPTTVRRGSVAWTSAGARTGDGPNFFVALADHPQLGLSHTVWADVVRADLQLLNDLEVDDKPLPFTVTPRASHLV
uniref:Apple domain-containing protein n=2 Tax=Chrysotila carterae TaxID=13221 RepID=A0A7S4F994_CHRCT|mmetsp:Transcript_13536/g.29220  ORF Transcript_13536/g.29220 Transcript_13536/m.29220 type:complete len:588 (+) Transcript_13536:309-2072(+)